MLYDYDFRNRHFERKHFSELISQYNDPDWFATLTFPDNEKFSPYVVKKYRLRWTRRLCIDEGIQVAYWYVESWISGHPTLHLVMFGYGDHGQRDLTDVKRRKWEKNWPFDAKIVYVSNLEGVAKYVADHQLWKKSDKAEIDCYNIKLLNKLRKKR